MGATFLSLHILPEGFWTTGKSYWLQILPQHTGTYIAWQHNSSDCASITLIYGHGVLGIALSRMGSKLFCCNKLITLRAMTP